MASRWRRFRLRSYHRRCDKLRIPADVRERCLKAGFPAPDWYAGRPATAGELADMRRQRRLQEGTP